MMGFQGSRTGEFHVRLSDTVRLRCKKRLGGAGVLSMCQSAHLTRHAFQD